jgi:sigma-B regulation protein RsbU (phosphoserine phosphatase)
VRRRARRRRRGPGRHYDDISFATGIIARLTTGSGQLEWSCAGHPRPLPLRGRKIVAELSCDVVLPLGLGDGAPKPRVAELEPDDAVLLYTDGVTEARTADGEQFRLDRLVGLLEREAASGRTAERTAAPPGAGRARASGWRGLRDDATLLLVQWTGT